MFMLDWLCPFVTGFVFFSCMGEGFSHPQGSEGLMDLGLVLGVPPYLHRTGWKRSFLLPALPQGPGAHSVEWAVVLDLFSLATGATWI